MTVGITEIATVCAVITCGGTDEAIDETPPLATMTMDEVIAQVITPEYAPYKDEETAEYNRTINELRDEVGTLKDELKDVEEAKERAEDKAKAAQQTSDNSGDDVPAVESDDGSKAVGQTFESTYYSAYCPSCGEWGGITATGDDISTSIYVRGKRVVAVDPNVIPLGSTVKVTTPNETFEALALDSGGDIKGNRLDILVESTEKAYALGRHNVTVEVLK